MPATDIVLHSIQYLHLHKLLITHSTKKFFQILTAGILCFAYLMGQVLVIVHIILRASSEGLLSPTTLIVLVIVGVPTFAALVHPSVGKRCYLWWILLCLVCDQNMYKVTADVQYSHLPLTYVLPSWIKYILYMLR